MLKNNSTESSNTSNSQPSTQSNLPKWPLIILVACAIFGTIAAVIFLLLTPKNPYQTKAHQVTVISSGTPFSILEKAENGKNTIWVPTSLNGVIVGSINDNNMHFAMVFEGDKQVEINATTTAKTIAALHPFVEDYKQVYTSNYNFGQVSLPINLETEYFLAGSNLDSSTEETEFSKSLQKIATVLLEESKSIPLKNQDSKNPEVANIPQQKFAYDELIFTHKNFDYKDVSWQPVILTTNEFGPILQNNSNAEITVDVYPASVDGKENQEEFTQQKILQPKQTIRFDGDESWSEGNYLVEAHFDEKKAYTDFYLKMAKMMYGEVSWPENQDDFYNFIIEKDTRTGNEVVTYLVDFLNKESLQNIEYYGNFFMNFVVNQLDSKVTEQFDIYNSNSRLATYIMLDSQDTFKASFTVSPPFETFKNDEFNIGLDYLNTWEIETKRERTQFGPYASSAAETLAIVLRKDNANVTIDFRAMEQYFGPIPNACVSQMNLIDTGGDVYRTKSYKTLSEEGRLIDPQIENNKFIYFFKSQINLDNVKISDVTVWESMRDVIDFENKSCFLSTNGTSYLIKTTMKNENYPNGMPAFINVQYSWTGELNAQNLAEADKIMSTLKIEEYQIKNNR